MMQSASASSASGPGRSKGWHRATTFLCGGLVLIGLAESVSAKHLSGSPVAPPQPVSALSAEVGPAPGGHSDVCDAGPLSEPARQPCAGPRTATTNFDLWEVNTRHLACGAGRCPPTLEAIRYYRRHPSGRYVLGDLPQLLGELAERAGEYQAAVIYVHGNWMEWGNTRRRQETLAHLLAARSDKPLLLISLSWPSQRETGPFRDVRHHAQCADQQAFALAGLLGRLDEVAPQLPVGLVGFSLGARTITAGLHLGAGGSVEGMRLVDVPDRLGQYRVSLVAAAVDRSWLHPHGRHALAMVQVDQLVNLYNSQDPILQRFRFIDLTNRPAAGGFQGFITANGPRVSSPLIPQPRVLQIDCSSCIGASHAELDYYGLCSAMPLALDNVLWRTAEDLRVSEMALALESP
jgi:hypothetical protein